MAKKTMAKRVKTVKLKTGKTRVYTESADGKMRYSGGTASAVKRTK